MQSNLFIHIPGTGSDKLLEYPIFSDPLPKVPSPYASDFVKQMGLKPWKDTFTFSIVRNPYDRLVDIFNHYMKLSQDPKLYAGDSIHSYIAHEFRRRCYDGFKEFVYSWARLDNAFSFTQQGHFRQQCRWVCHAHGYDYLVKYLGRYEYLEDSITHVCNQIGCDQIKLDAIASDGPDYRTLYDPSLARIVHHFYRYDFERFGYEKDFEK